MAHVHNIAHHHIETPNKRCQMELLTRGMREESVAPAGNVPHIVPLHHHGIAERQA